MNSILFTLKSNIYSQWPALEFLNSSKSEVLNYFSSGNHLPLNWNKHQNDMTLINIISKQYPSLIHSQSVDRFVGDILSHLPPNIRQECLYLLENKNIWQ